MLENDVEASKLDLTFAIDEDELGCIISVDLKEVCASLGNTWIPSVSYARAYLRLQTWRARDTYPEARAHIVSSFGHYDEDAHTSLCVRAYAGRLSNSCHE
jgi:hypothetical protein